MPELPFDTTWLTDPDRWGFGVMDPRVLVIGIGIILVIAGARTYKLMLLTPGFVAGVLAAVHYLPANGDLKNAGIALLVGVVGAMLLVYAERTALRVLGAMVMVGLVEAVAPMVMGSHVAWYVPAVAAVVGGIVVPMVIKRMLKVITPVMGALAIAWAFDRPDDLWLIGGVSLIGIVVQVIGWRGKKGS